ncbi:unnamed protein product [Symbiodinium natans]|uniref:Class I SAM-dependent methyltransferase n=1 Tax=Symbiodinium natans TaxID=878477 RepID=A0A812SWW0_9DINO|nr:unnamed protein product [Symbiodinium natans]
MFVAAATTSLDLGLQCVHSLFQAGSLFASTFRDARRQEEAGGRRLQWSFVRRLGRNRTNILAGLLSMVAEEGRELRAAEVGVFMGETSSKLLGLFENLRILLVDPYHLHTENHTTQFNQFEEFYISSRSTFLAAAGATQRFRRRASFVLQTSAGLQWLRGDLDLVFLDGDHRYGSVRKDIEVFWPLLRPHGILAGHDFAPTFPGVVEAVTEFALEFDLELLLAAEVWWVFKPPLAGSVHPGRPEWLSKVNRRGSCYN